MHNVNSRNFATTADAAAAQRESYQAEIDAIKAPLTKVDTSVQVVVTPDYSYADLEAYSNDELLVQLRKALLEVVSATDMIELANETVQALGGSFTPEEAHQVKVLHSTLVIRALDVAGELVIRHLLKSLPVTEEATAYISACGDLAIQANTLIAEGVLVVNREEVV